MAGASSSSASLQVQHSRTYDVFLSFRGEDTRYGFTGNLYHALEKKGIKTFIDIDLTRGDEISRTLPKAIQDSRISIIIFSENYASSKWCLDELAEILNCRESKQQIVVPVFYKVEPSDIGHDKGSFEKALAEHEIKFKDNEEKVRGWRRALQQASKLSGWPFKEGEYEFEFINKIVEWISVQLLNYTNVEVAKYPVAIQSRLQDMDKLLGVGENDRRIVGIWGTPGIGKTTIAKAIFNLIGHKFDGRCILENVGEKSKSHEGIAQLQGTLLYEILGESKYKEINFSKGIKVIKERLSHKRLLLILDDVNELDWLSNLVEHAGLFGEGSRVIITTKNKSLLIDHGIKLIYEVKKLDEQQSLELFSWHAFGRNEPPDKYVELARHAIRNAECLPLALQLLGAHFRKVDSIDRWKETLNTYNIAPSYIQNTLRICYNALKDDEREAFLDIACFFNGEQSTKYLIEILKDDELGFCRNYIEVLTQNAIITLDQYNRISMHSLLEQMGKDIVRQESPLKPEERSRLWFYKEVYRVLTKNKGTDKIKGIKLNLLGTDVEIRLNAKSFSGMTNLQYFINCNGRLSGCVDYLPNSLKLIDWGRCGLDSFPTDFHPEELVVLNMPRSRIRELGGLFQHFTKLKSLNFSCCNLLTKIPNVSGMPNIEDLSLTFCEGLVEVDQSVGRLKSLVTLDLKGCDKLTMFPASACWEKLKKFSLVGCKRLESFPKIVGKMARLRDLELHDSGIKELPSSIRNITGLEFLDASGCGNLINLPDGILDLQHLWVVHLHGCPKLVRGPNYKVKSEVSGSAESLHMVLPTNFNIPRGNCGLLALPVLFRLDISDSNLSDIDFLGNLDCLSTLEVLKLSGSSFVSLPEGISKFVGLSDLYLDYCKRLRTIPKLPPNVKYISVAGCISLETFSALSNILEHNDTQGIKYMKLSNCQRLCDKLGLDVEKMANRLLNQVKNSCFEVAFPGNEVPKWFHRREEIPVVRNVNGEKICELVMEIPQNFSWENTGLALCVAFEITSSLGSCEISSSFTINGHSVHSMRSLCSITSTGAKSTPNVWLNYIPLPVHWKSMLDVETETPPPPLPYVWRPVHRKSMLDIETETPPLPYVCRVEFNKPYGLRVKSCGVHLAGMPQNGNEDENKDDEDNDVDDDDHHQKVQSLNPSSFEERKDDEQPCLKKQRTSYFYNFLDGLP